MTTDTATDWNALKGSTATPAYDAAPAIDRSAVPAKTDKPRSMLGNVLHFGGYWWVTFLVASAATYVMYWLNAFLNFASNRVGTNVAIPVKEINAEALSMLDAVTSTIHFSIFVAVCAVGAVLCRNGAK